jgi:DNA mismatch endonuclease Vsr
MRAVKSKRTGPERRLHAILARLHLRNWKANYTNAPGNPDFAFPEQKLALFVDGCFWHGCPICQRPLPATNVEYWTRKISRNVERDKLYNAQLAEAGWRVLRVWEHELKQGCDYRHLVARIVGLVRG